MNSWDRSRRDWRGSRARNFRESEICICFFSPLESNGFFESFERNWHEIQLRSWSWRTFVKRWMTGTRELWPSYLTFSDLLELVDFCFQENRWKRVLKESYSDSVLCRWTNFCVITSSARRAVHSLKFCFALHSPRRISREAQRTFKVSKE